MKLLRYGAIGAERPGLLDSSGQIRDVSSFVEDWSGTSLCRESLARVAALDPTDLPIVESGVRMGACVGNPGKFLCIGLNYSDHAAESGMEVPTFPVVFSKATSAVVGPYDPIEIPRGSIKTDWEVELGVVVGDPMKYVDADQALDYVAGYCVVNDLSERTLQLEVGGQWVKGKSHDTFGPVGPWLVTTDEIQDPQNLSLWLEVDEHRYQEGSTQRMVFSVAELLSHLSECMTLLPGDIVSTGTPPGVGMGQKPEPVYLKAGQQIRLGIEGLGIQEQRTIPWRPLE